MRVPADLSGTGIIFYIPLNVISVKYSWCFCFSFWKSLDRDKNSFLNIILRRNAPFDTSRTQLPLEGQLIYFKMSQSKLTSLAPHPSSLFYCCCTSEAVLGRLSLPSISTVRCTCGRTGSEELPRGCGGSPAHCAHCFRTWAACCGCLRGSVH